jgi:hypothetical protein
MIVVAIMIYGLWVMEKVLDELRTDMVNGTWIHGYI